MSSSISISNPPGATRRDGRRAALFCATLAACLLPVAGLNAWMDPCGRFGRAPLPSANLALVSQIEVARLGTRAPREAEVVILGDSRGWLLTPQRLAPAGGRLVLNLSLQGASFEEMLSFFHQQAPSLKQLRVLIVTVSLGRFAEKPRANRCVESQPLAASALRYLLNLDLLGESWAALRAPARPPASGEVPLPPAKVAARHAAIVKTWQNTYPDWKPARADERLEALRQVVEPLRARGVQVVLWCPPLHPDVQALAGPAGVEREWQRVLAALREMAPVADLTAAAGIGGVPFYFKDPVHTTEGSLILETLLTAPASPRPGGPL